MQRTLKSILWLPLFGFSLSCQAGELTVGLPNGTDLTYRDPNCTHLAMETDGNIICNDTPGPSPTPTATPTPTPTPSPTPPPASCPGTGAFIDPDDRNGRKFSQTFATTTLSYVGYVSPGSAIALPFVADDKVARAILSISDGSGYGDGDYVISRCPGDFTPVPSYCGRLSTKSGFLRFSADKCPLVPGQKYYVNVRSASSELGDGFLLKRSQQ